MTIAVLSELVATWGYLLVFVAVCVASAGIPVPAAEILVAAAIYAAHTHRLSIVVLVAAGSVGAIGGGMIGYGLGRTLGAASLARFGRYVGLGPARMRLGQYLFLVHGGKIVFFLRFVALLGPFGGLLAGTNRMPWGRFSLFNALGSVVWTLLVGVGAYAFGAFFQAVDRTVGIAAIALAIGLVVFLLIYVHRREAALQQKADALLSGS
ncbi:MAG: VTT domain-containing protein [Caulobacteraceae bacterium]